MTKTLNSEQKRVAYHEAGHAVASCLTRRRLQTVTIIQDKERAGYVSYNPWQNFHPDCDLSPQTIRKAKIAIFTALAGPVAESIFMRRRKLPGSDSDFQRVFDMATRLCGDMEEANAYVKFMWEQTRNVVELHWDAIRDVARALLQHKTLRYRQVRQVTLSAFGSEEMPLLDLL